MITRNIQNTEHRHVHHDIFDFKMTWKICDGETVNQVTLSPNPDPNPNQDQKQLRPYLRRAVDVIDEQSDRGLFVSRPQSLGDHRRSLRPVRACESGGDVQHHQDV